jgi:hypothetical protein
LPLRWPGRRPPAVADRCGDVCPHHGRREATCVAHTHR